MYVDVFVSVSVSVCARACVVSVAVHVTCLASSSVDEFLSNDALYDYFQLIMAFCSNRINCLVSLASLSVPIRVMVHC